MIDASGLKPVSEEKGRETWVRLVVLAVCVLVVGVYAARTSGLGASLREFLGGSAFAGILPFFLGGLALVLGAVAVRAWRESRAGQGGTAAETAAPERPVLAARNRTAAVRNALAAADPPTGAQPALHVLDLDRFGQINRALGEEAGDLVLERVTKQLAALAESPDLLVRIGDDEFAIVQSDAGGVRHADIFARRIRNAVEDACANIPAHLRPGVSIGAALHLDGADPSITFQRASAALHAAKGEGGGSFRLHSSQMEATESSRAWLEEAVRDGLERGWFDVAFQPQYDLATRRLMGFEALARLYHPERGDVAPEDFLPVAESIGLLQPLGAWVIEKAIATATEWPAHLVLSINVSPAQFRHGDIAATVVAALAKSCFDGERLNLEISEALLWRPSEAVRRQLRRLKRRGVHIVLDDFGVETSALHALARSTCDAVKLDRSFVQRLGEEPEADAVVRGLIGTAQAFDLTILAEGIERPEQAHFLMKNACRKVQGFLFGRPAPLTEIGAIIARDMRRAVAEARTPTVRRSGPAYPASIAASRISR